MDEHTRQQFLRSTPEELQKIVESYGPDRPEGAFCLMLLQSKRQEAIEERLDALRKPHWTLTPTFWFVVVGTIAGVVGAIIGWAAFHSDQPVQSPSAYSSSPPPQPTSAASQPAAAPSATATSTPQ